MNGKERAEQKRWEREMQEIEAREPENTDHLYPRWKCKVELTRAEIAEILDGLSEVRDPFGDEAGDLEVRLSNLLHKYDRQAEERS